MPSTPPSSCQRCSDAPEYQLLYYSTRPLYACTGHANEMAKEDPRPYRVKQLHRKRAGQWTQLEMRL